MFHMKRKKLGMRNEELEIAVHRDKIYSGEN